jgi:hypothetical protein
MEGYMLWAIATSAGAPILYRRFRLYLLYPPLLPLLASRNLLVYQSLLTNTPYRHAMVRRRKDDTCVGPAARGIVA